MGIPSLNTQNLNIVTTGIREGEMVDQAYSALLKAGVLKGDTPADKVKTALFGAITRKKLGLIPLYLSLTFLLFL